MSDPIRIQRFTAALTSQRYNAVLLTPRYHAMLRTPEAVPGPAGPAGPMGPQGPPGTSIDILDPIDGQMDLPPYGEDGQIIYCQDEGTLWYWDEATESWRLMGDIEGAPGPVGPTGPQGAQGPTGATGSTGPAGPTGAQGPQGPTGPQGAVGPGTNWRGSVATAANLPPSGTQGDAYIALDTQHAWVWASPTGWFDAGNVKGPQGDPGPTGAQGPAGATGATGPQGATGSQGPVGATGATGPQGAKGDPGAQGPQGPTGATGAQGPAGADSTVPGPQGPAGATGPQGPPTSIQDEGSGLTQRTVLNFVGAGVTASDDSVNGRTLITIPGGGSQTPWTQDINAATFKLSSVGSIGIGVAANSSAGRLLDLSGNVAGGAVTVNVNNSGANSYAGMQAVSSGVTCNVLAANISGSSGLQLNSTGDIMLLTGSERMRITSGGNVGIGTASPPAKLAVSGDGASSSNADDSQFVICGSSNSNKRLSFGFDTTNNAATIYSFERTVAMRSLILNPGGGQVMFGYVTNTLWNLALLGNSQMGFYVNEGTNQLLFVVRYASGVVKSAALTLA